MTVTMKDVAKHAGVSKSTVSQYLNKRYEYMSTTTKEKIEKSIEELNYIPNQLARGLKKRKTNVIAIVASRLSSRFTTEFISIVEKNYSILDIDVIVASTEDDIDQEKKLVESLISRQVDGIMIFPNNSNKEFYQELYKKGYPMIFVDRYIDNCSIESVVLDNRMAGRIATNILLENGHKKIAILSFQNIENISNRWERVQGYRDALKNENINYEQVIQSAPNDVYKNLEKIFRLIDKPTGLVLSNDILLEKSLYWFKKNTINLPKDISIVSIDDVSFASIFTPSITTVSQPISAMANKACDILYRKINKIENIDENINMFSPTLYKRDSIQKLN